MNGYTPTRNERNQIGSGPDNPVQAEPLGRHGDDLSKQNSRTTYTDYTNPSARGEQYLIDTTITFTNILTKHSLFERRITGIHTHSQDHDADPSNSTCKHNRRHPRLHKMPSQSTSSALTTTKTSSQRFRRG
jgi:hypothetical protein